MACPNPTDDAMIAISDADFDRAVAEALRAVPPEFKPHLENVLIEVVPRPTPALQRAEDVPDDILGLYVGSPLEDKALDSGFDQILPDRILIFRDNLREMCGSREELIEEIRITVLHEIGHHFGLDEDQLDELGFG